MTTQKVSITLEAGAISQARRVAGTRGMSSYVNEAPNEKLASDERCRSPLAYLDELEVGDPTPQKVNERAQQRAGRLRSASE